MLLQEIRYFASLRSGMDGQFNLTPLVTLQTRCCIH